MAAKKKTKKEVNENLIYDDANISLEIKEAGIVYSLIKTEKDSGKTYPIFVDSNTTRKKFVMDCTEKFFIVNEE